MVSSHCGNLEKKKVSAKGARSKQRMLKSDLRKKQVRQGLSGCK